MKGIILAGGASSRMGTDKALLRLDGRSLLLRLAERMLAVCDSLIVAVGDGSRETAYREELAGLAGRTAFVRDRYPGSGPLAGLHAALASLADGYAFVMACDMPQVSETLALRMMERAGLAEASPSAVTGGAASAPGMPADESRACGPGPDVVRAPDQPFHALYHARTAALIERLLRQGDLRVMGLLRQLAAAVVEPRDERERGAFVNLNTPEAYGEYLRGEDPAP